MSHDAGPLGGHGVAVAMAAIFVGIGIIFAAGASDGAIFGLNFTDQSGGNAPTYDAGGKPVSEIPQAAFDEPDTQRNVTTVAAEDNDTISEQEQELLGISDFAWNSVLAQQFATSQDAMDKFDQQNYTRPPRAPIESFFLIDEVSVDIERSPSIEVDLFPEIDRDDDEPEDVEQAPEEETDEPEVEEEPEETPEVPSEGNDSENDSGGEPPDETDDQDSAGDTGDSDVPSNSTDSSGNSTSTEDPDSSSNEGNSTSSG